LAPGETKRLQYVLGYFENPKDKKFDPPGSQVLNKALVKPKIAHFRDIANADAAFDALVRQKADALAVGADPFFSSRGEQVLALAARQGLQGLRGLAQGAPVAARRSWGPAALAQPGAVAEAQRVPALLAAGPWALAR